MFASNAIRRVSRCRIPSRANITIGPSAFEVGKNYRTIGSWKNTNSGEQTFTHFADGTAHKNRMQGNDFVQSPMYNRGVKCSSCHDVHGTETTRDC